MLALLAFTILGANEAISGGQTSPLPPNRGAGIASAWNADPSSDGWSDPRGGSVPTHGARATWIPGEGWDGSRQPHTPGMRGMTPWTGARLSYGDVGQENAHPVPTTDITNIVTNQERLDTQKILLGISDAQNKLWDHYVAAVLTHNALIQEVVKLSQADASSQREHAELHAELNRTMLAHGTDLKTAYDKLLAALPENKRVVLNRSYDQVLYQHQQMGRFIKETFRTVMPF